MLLWKDMYPAREGPALTGMEWDKWGRPRGGFIDLGCVSVPRKRKGLTTACRETRS